LPLRFLAAATIFYGLLSFAAQPRFAQSSQDSTVAQRRRAHLRYGINLSEWFAQVYDAKGYTKEHFETWNTAEDIALIKAMGFDHVRLSVNPQPMLRHNEADRIPADYLGYLDAAVQLILDQGLAVIIDLHPDSDLKEKLATDNGAVEQFGDFWRALAQHYSKLDPGMVFFEILNEPEGHDGYRWYGIQARVAVAIREGAPQHSIIAAGARWSDDDDLLFIEPLRDPNIIYTFHFYSPHVFTHQGATWGENYWHFVKGLPYPSNPDNVVAAASLVPDPAKRLQVARYGMDRWNAARMDAEFDQVAAWGKRWGVPLLCGEFGVYRKAARPEDRAVWISDVRKSLEKHGIGWTLWDYSGGFGVVTKKNGRPVPDDLTLKALGLKTTAASH
jgi:aryl-phospho-beta-D-glucosidase BglC (GH1 family)